MFNLHEIPQARSQDDGKTLIGGFRCRNHESSTNVGGYVNLGLPLPFSRVQYRDTREEVRTNIRLHLYPVEYGGYWDGFNLPVWAMEKHGFLFVRTYCPKTDQSYVDVIQDGSVALLLGVFGGCIDITNVADKMKL